MKPKYIDLEILKKFALDLKAGFKLLIISATPFSNFDLSELEKSLL